MLKQELIDIDLDKELIIQILNENKGNIIGYIRTAQYDDSEIVIRQQENIIISFCKEFNVECKEIYIDDGFSGLNYDRPGIRKITNSSEKKVILMSNITRLTRNFTDMMNFISNNNKIIIGITDGIIIKK